MIYKSMRDSQERYNLKKPILSFRIEREVYDLLKDYEKRTGQKPRDILKNYFRTKSNIEKEQDFKLLAVELGYEVTKKKEEKRRWPL